MRTIDFSNNRKWCENVLSSKVNGPENIKSLNSNLLEFSRKIFMFSLSTIISSNLN